MLFAGPISSLFDFLTFYVLLHVLHADQRLFHTGWFVESLATQTLVLFVVRTRGNPLVNRPSGALAATVVGAVAVGLILPATPLAGVLGFTVPPWPYLVFLVAATAAYLLLVESLKRWLLKTANQP
jgi:Mg2+-importing ATPase